MINEGLAPWQEYERKATELGIGVGEFFYKTVCEKKSSEQILKEHIAAEKKSTRVLPGGRTVKKTFICEMCGAEYKKYSFAENLDSFHTFCSEKCKTEFYWWKKRDKKNKKSLAQWNEEARACGMTYGVYRAQIEKFGKTFEELKLDNPPDVSKLENFFHTFS